MIDAAMIRACADGAKVQVLEGVKAVHAGELLTAELHFSLAQQALLKLERLLDESPRPLRKLCLVGDRAPVDPGEPDLPAWMNEKHGGDDGAA
jgi:hypothetical protein